MTGLGARLTGASATTYDATRVTNSPMSTPRTAITIRPRVSARRERQHESVRAEILVVARRLLNEGGAPLVSLRAIAREMGLTAPALYRYYDNRGELLSALCAQLCAEVATVTRVAHAGARRREPGHALFDAARAARAWMLEHPTEALLVFAAPTPATPSQLPPISLPGVRQFQDTFFEMFSDLWRSRRFPVPADSDINPDLARHLRTETGELGRGLPIGLIQSFTQCWIRLYGVMCMELFGRFPLPSQGCAHALFEDTLRDISSTLGVPEAYRPPAA